MVVGGSELLEQAMRNTDRIIQRGFAFMVVGVISILLYAIKKIKNFLLFGTTIKTMVQINQHYVLRV